MASEPKILTLEEFSSLLTVGKTPVNEPPAKISAEHSARLTALGYIVDLSGRLRMTAPGRRRIAAGFELANAVEPYFDNRILIEKINGPFLYELRGTPAEYKAGLDRAIANGWLVLHESGTFVRFTQAGADLFA
jgi:hypothetical protein